MITATFLHCASLRDCQHDVGRIQIKKWQAQFGRNLLCLVRGGEQIPRKRRQAERASHAVILPYSRETVSYPRQFNHITTDYVSPAELQNLSYPRKRRSSPGCSPLESSHPFARLQPTTAYLYLPTMTPCHGALVLESLAPPLKFYCIKGCMSMEACVLRCLC